MGNANQRKTPSSREELLADEYLLRTLAVEAWSTYESVVRALQGFKMRILTRERIRVALAARGLDAFLPAQPPSPIRKRTTEAA
jgi:anti-sigma-K factor RskA